MGLLDADVYGPSIPKMMGLSDYKHSKKNYNKEGKIIFPSVFGVKVLSIGFIIEENQPVIWRGPMAIAILDKLIKDSDLDDIDTLVVDLPPGTGDVQISITQKMSINGAIIVSTPQDIALLDTIKSINMFHKVNVPIVGLIENMSYYQCPNCKHIDNIFDHGGVQESASKLNTVFLGKIPLSTNIRISSDKGTPEYLRSGGISRVYKSIAEKIYHKITQKSESINIPEINYE